jgi:integrase/recombinase XerD
MRVILYKRHTGGCPYKADKTSGRCDCSVWLGWNVDGKQTRQSAKTSSWEEAEQKAQSLKAKLTGRADPVATTVKDAVDQFMGSKHGEHLSPNTLYKHTLTLKRLQEFCDAADLLHVRDVTLSHLTAWRAKWTLKSPLAQRNEQERVKSFFKYCYNAGFVRANPTAQLSSVQVKVDEATRVCVFEPKEYKAILAAVAKTGLQPHNKARVRACMQLQRWSGLSLVDAVCLSAAELERDGKAFRVRTKRRKTGAAINNNIPPWLGKELLNVKNGNREYIFVSGEATPKGAVSTFDKMYRATFKAAGITGTSHMFRHTFAVECLKAGVDVRKVSKALGHSSVTITERYYAKWNKAQQDILDGDLASAWRK